MAYESKVLVKRDSFRQRRERGSAVTCRNNQNSIFPVSFVVTHQATFLERHQDVCTIPCL